MDEFLELICGVLGILLLGLPLTKIGVEDTLSITLVITEEVAP